MKLNFQNIGQSFMQIEEIVAFIWDQIHHSEETFTARVGDRIAQVVFMKIYNVDFEEVSDPCFLGKTKPGFDGFSSAGVATTKKFKRDPDSGMIVLTNKK